MPDYPPLIVEQAFASETYDWEKDIDELLLYVQRSARNEGGGNTHDTKTCGVTSLKVRSLRTEKYSRSSACSTDPAQAIPSVSDKRFHFAPVLEDLEIQWTFEGHGFITGATLELFRDVSGKAQRLWTKKMVWKAGGCPKECSTLFNGTFRADEKFRSVTGAKMDDVTITAEAGVEQDFPDACLTVRHSPYKLVLTITDALSAKSPSARWLFLDVLVHSVELDWGDATTFLPPERPDLADPASKPKVLGYETDIYKELKRANPRPKQDTTHEVILTSNLFAKKPKDAAETLEFEQRKDFEEHANLWGDGPRIVLLGKVLVRQSDGSGTEEATAALVGGRLYWNWQDDKPDRWKDYLAGKATSKTQDFLKQIIHEHNDDVKPAGTSNCPSEYGGKLGDVGKPIFLRQEEAGKFPFIVEDCPKRPWGALSHLDLSAKGKGNSGVIFQPARMAGDRYAVTVTFCSDPDALPAEGEPNVPEQLRCRGGQFIVYRRVNLRYLFRGPNDLGVTPQQCADSLKTTYKRTLNLIVDVTQEAVDNNKYKAAKRKAIAKASRGSRGFYKQVQILPLTLRHLVRVDDIPDGSPGVCFRDRPEFLQRIEHAFKNGRIQHVRISNSDLFFQGEDILGGTTRTRGVLLNTVGDSSQAPAPAELVLIEPPDAAFMNDETVTGQASNANGRITVLPSDSCWGHEFPESISSDDAAYKTAVTVSVSGRTAIKISFGKHSLSRGVKTELTDAAKRQLRDEMVNACRALGHQAELKIQLTGKTSSDNARNRLAGIKAEIEQLFTTRVIIDRKAVLADLCWTFKTDGTHRQQVQRTMPDMILPFIVEAYLEDNYPTEEGIFLLHIPGMSNVRDLPESKKPYNSFNPLAFTDKKVEGSYYGDRLTSRNQAVICLSTVDSARIKVEDARSKSIVSIFNHEVGHALFLPHAPGRTNPGGFKPQCHVGGDNCLMNYDLDSEHFCGLCMLRTRGWDWKKVENAAPEQEYRIELALGEMDELFGNLFEDRELAARLQVLGLFSRPLNHPEFDRCLDFSLQHLERIFPAMRAPDEATVRQELAKEMKDFILQGGALPPPGQFAKLRLPGGWSVMYSQNYLMMKYPGPAQAVPEDAYALGATRFQVEQSYWDANQALGKVPLVARVKRRPKGSDEPWASAAAAASVRVYFQLVKPDSLPAPQPVNPDADKLVVAGGSSFYKQVVNPELDANPKNYLKATVEQYKPSDTNDPQAANAHADLGGRRKSPDPLFCGTKEEGFLKLPTAKSEGKHDHTVAVNTDELGVAKVCFTPSRIGGDSYKIRAYVGPPSQDRDGTVAGPDVVETGTMVVWRSVRVCRYIWAEAPANAGELSADLQAIGARTCRHSEYTGASGQRKDIYDSGRICAACMLREGPLDPVDLKGAISLELAKAFCELLVEPRADRPESISPHAQDILNKAKEFLADYPVLNGPTRCKNQTGSSELIGIEREPLSRVGGSDTHFKVTLKSFTPSPGNVSLRPKGGGESSKLAEDDADGTPKIVEGDQVQSFTVDYETGEVEVHFKVPQAGKDFDIVYRADNFVDLEQLLVFPAKSPYLFQLRFPPDYNAAIRPGTLPMPVPGPADSGKPGYPRPNNVYYQMCNRKGKEGDGLILSLMMNSLVRGIDRNNGFYPGLLIFQAAMLDNYSSTWDYGVQEGKGVENGIFLFGANMFKTRGGYTLAIDQDNIARNQFGTLALHEFSHGLYLQHAIGSPMPGGAREDLHDPLDVCVMTYDTNNGDYCGQCVASLRGLNTAAAPFKFTPQTERVGEKAR